MSSPTTALSPEMRPGTYTGWWISLGIIVGVLAIGTVLWLAYHP